MQFNSSSPTVSIASSLPPPVASYFRVCFRNCTIILLHLTFSNCENRQSRKHNQKSMDFVAFLSKCTHRKKKRGHVPIRSARIKRELSCSFYQHAITLCTVPPLDQRWDYQLELFACQQFLKARTRRYFLSNCRWAQDGGQTSLWERWSVLSELWRWQCYHSCSLKGFQETGEQGNCVLPSVYCKRLCLRFAADEDHCEKSLLTLALTSATNCRQSLCRWRRHLPAPRKYQSESEIKERGRIGNLIISFFLPGHEWQISSPIMKTTSSV